MSSGDTWVYDFSQGSKEQKDLLGGKGANLAEMTTLGLPVPPGFTITTDACRYYLEHGTTPDELGAQVGEHLAALEQAMGRTLGDPADPLLVSVRSGAAASMPGMMETVLNVGLTDESVRGLAEQAGSERFAWDSYRRLIQMFGKTVLGIDGELFDEAFDAVKAEQGTESDLDLDAEHLRDVVDRFKAIVREHTGRDFPQDPREQMDLAITAVFDSWNSDRAVIYRRRERIPSDAGTAVNVCAMVFGNLGMDSGTGVAFTRDPGSGAQGVYGDYLQNAQGRTSSPASATPCRWSTCRRSTGPPTTSSWGSWAGSSSTTATCATSSSPSSAPSCGCCRPGSASAPRRRRSSSPPSWSTRGSSTWTRPSAG